MRRLVSLSLVAGALLACPALAQVPAPPAPPKPTEGTPVPVEGPRMQLSARAVNFGEVIDDNIATHELTIRNVGTATLEIKGAHGSCTCVGAKAARKTVEPGQTETLVVYFNPSNRRGLSDKIVRVYTNDAVQPEREIRVKAVAKPRLWVNPSSVVYDQVAASETSVRKVQFVSRKPDFEIVAAEVASGDPALLRWEFEPRRYVRVDGEDLAAIDMKLYLDPKGQTGRLRSVVHVQTNDEQRPMTKVRVSGEIAGDVVLDTKVFSFRKVKSGVPKSLSAVVRTRDGQAFTVTDVRATGRHPESVTLKVSPVGGGTGPATAWRVDATIQAEARKRQIAHGEIVIQTDHNNESVKVQFSAIVDP
ncbi:MAG: DUF1573 domain-containing protein [Planctomycetota bacterium]